MLIVERGWLSVANSPVLSVAVPIVLPSTSPEDLTPGSLPESGRSSAASVDGEGEQENGEREKSVSSRQSPASPHPTTLSDGLGSEIMGFDGQVKKSPSDKMSDQSPSGLEDEKGENETKRSCSPDVDAPSGNAIKMEEQRDGEDDYDEDKDRDVVDDEEEEETRDNLVCSSVAPGLTSQKDDRFYVEHEASAHLSMTPEEAKKRGLSFDYTEPQDSGQQSGLTGWECSSDKTPPESKSPDSCRADPGSPLSPSGAAEPTHEESPLTDFQTNAREEEEEVPEEEEEDESSIPPCSQEAAETKIEPEAESEEHREPEEAREDKQEKYLETSDDVEMQNLQSAAKPEPDAALAKDKPSAQVMPSKGDPIKESPTKKPKKPVATVAATPSPKPASKLQKTPSKDAAPARKSSVPTKGLFSVLFLNLPTASSSITDILFLFPFSLISSRAVDLRSSLSEKRTPMCPVEETGCS